VLHMEVYPLGVPEDVTALDVQANSCGPALPPGNLRRPLWENQLRSLQWMMDREAAPVNILGEVRHISKCGVAPMQQLEALWRLRLQFKVSGGILADKIGSGKTATVLALALSDRHKMIPSLDGLPLQLQTLRPVRATLVVTPPHLLGQWKHEQEKVAPGLEALWVDSVKDLMQAKWEDLTRYDIVGISQRLFLSEAYHGMLGIAPSQRGSKCSREYVSKVGASRQGLNRERLGKNYCVENFYWRRVVFDEIHELRSDEDSLWMLPLRTICAQHRWGLTGTPPTSSFDDTTQAAVLLNLELGSSGEACAEFCNRAVRTNGLDAGEAVLEPVQHVVDVDLSPPERALYEYEQRRPRENVMEFTTNSIKACNASCNDEPADSALANLRSNLHAQIENYDRMHKMWVGIRAGKLNAPFAALSQDEVANRRGELEEAQDNVQIFGRHLEKSKGDLERLTQIEEQISEGARPMCPLCVGGVAHATALCGHAFCNAHMAQCVDSNRCAVCNAAVLASDVHAFEPSVTGAGPKRYGAKMHAVLAKIKELIRAGEKKILLYVQIDELRASCVKALLQENVKHVELKGNPAHITNILKQFSERNDSNVLVLSLARKAAGINLTCSSNIIFLHPFVDREQHRAIAWEAQAIGRVARPGQTKQVHVWRFLVRDTVEAELMAHSRASSWKEYFSKFTAIKSEP